MVCQMSPWLMWNLVVGNVPVKEQGTHTTCCWGRNTAATDGLGLADFSFSAPLFGRCPGGGVFPFFSFLFFWRADPTSWWWCWNQAIKLVQNANSFCPPLFPLFDMRRFHWTAMCHDKVQNLTRDAFLSVCKVILHNSTWVWCAESRVSLIVTIKIPVKTLEDKRSPLGSFLPRGRQIILCRSVENPWQ